ncbi:MAG TPA: TonB-dependent receptor plug domain-containing protein, partial [Flavitalea sp.]|nr:TonB-dependent receptor plug domain-containing protein [Flavitalea sp.]
MSTLTKTSLQVLCLLAIMVSSGLATIAQGIITGKVIDVANSQPLAGVTVSVKGSERSISTDNQGRFSITASPDELLVFSSVGYSTMEFKASEAANIRMTQTTNDLNEVVITALGIKKEKKKLGYAIQEVKGDDLTVARETNVVNQLSGKIAGVTVVGSPSGIGGSARVTIRGERSLNLNKNQPLYVIDGVPISNAITSGSGGGNMEVDYGNGASFINPDDIESMSVLKGPAAAALYGSRAANGVILIKSKSGSRKKGIGVEVNTNLTLESALKLPDYQKVYGQGNASGGDFKFVDGRGGGLSDGTDEGWGPAYKGQLFEQYNSPRTLNGEAIDFTA